LLFQNHLEGGRPRAQLPAVNFVVHGLGFHVLAMYGITYYAIGVAAPSMARDLGTTTATIFALFGVAFFLNALSAPRVGRTIDRIGAGPVLLVGSILRAMAILALAVAPGIWSFTAAMLALQMLSQSTEYDAVFSAAVQAQGQQARTSVSVITLWGGLASTAFWPLSAYLLAQDGWRMMFAYYALLVLAVSIPVSLLVMRQASQRRAFAASRPPPVPVTPVPGAGTKKEVDPVLAFVPLALAFSLSSIAMGLPVILPVMLTDLGLGASAVVAGMLFGPSQTAARFFELVFARRITPLAVAVIATGLLPLSLLVLVAGGDHMVSAVIFAILFGAGNGVGYVVRGTVVLSLFGPAHYGSWLGRLARIRLVVSSVTPFTLALILEHYGAVVALTLCGVCGLLAMFAFFRVWQRFA
jgi:MFS family permease